MFTGENVKSICKVGRSSKTPKDYIGYLGVGIKSVFLVSDSPEVRSGGFHFKFDRNAWSDPAHTPWQVIPLWIQVEPLEAVGFGTVFKLPVKDVTLLRRIRDKMKPEQLNDRMLLFLRHVEEIELNDADAGYTRKIVKSMPSKTDRFEEGKPVKSLHSNRKKSLVLGPFSHVCLSTQRRQTSILPWTIAGLCARPPYTLARPW